MFNTVIFSRLTDLLLPFCIFSNILCFAIYFSPALIELPHNYFHGVKMVELSPFFYLICVFVPRNGFLVSGR